MAYPLFHPRSRRQAPLALAHEAFAGEFQTENDHVEFKAGAGEQPIQDTAVAFSNHQGGVILLGVADDGAVRGRPLDVGTADAIHRALSNAHNIGRYELHALDVNGVGLTVVSIARREEGFAQTSSGRVLARRGTRDASLFGGELQRFINERSVTRFETTLTDVRSPRSTRGFMRAWPPRRVGALLAQLRSGSTTSGSCVRDTSPSPVRSISCPTLPPCLASRMSK